MRRCNKCAADKVELVHKQIIPVPSKTMYEEAISRGDFTGTFKEYQEYMRGSIEVDPETGNWVINGQDIGIKAEGKDGTVLTVGPNGNWYIDGQDTGLYAGAVVVGAVGEDNFFDL